MKSPNPGRLPWDFLTSLWCFHSSRVLSLCHSGALLMIFSIWGERKVHFALSCSVCIITLLFKVLLCQAWLIPLWPHSCTPESREGYWIWLLDSWHPYLRELASLLGGCGNSMGILTEKFEGSLICSNSQQISTGWAREGECGSGVCKSWVQSRLCQLLEGMTLCKLQIFVGDSAFIFC